MYVQEQEKFLALFPHRYDFIYAPHPDPNAKPEWRTEARYPLSDRQLLKSEYLYGVRFEKTTQYFLLDIDHTSPYHPSNDPLVCDRLFAALEPLGITDHIVCTSSDSQGLHLYFPLAKAFNSWKLAKVIETALANAGFKLKLGQLELFPNPKTYNTGETPTLFNAHRLPLQMGSYLLNDKLQPTSSSQTTFVRMWEFCQHRNSLNTRRLRILLKKAKQVSYQLSHKASKFLNDLNTEIEEGWTAHGQTNRLLGRITMRAFVFNHITEGGEPLAGKALVNKVVTIAKALPGYDDWCRHRHEIEARAQEWARCIEDSHYFPYGSAQGKYKALKPDETLDKPNWNQQRSQETQAKIVAAVQDMTAKQTLPQKATARFKSLLKYGIGGASLYRYRELWHPIELNNLRRESEPQNTDFGSACTGGANAPKAPTSLLSKNDSNTPNDEASSNSVSDKKDDKGNNFSDLAQAMRDRIRQQLAQTQRDRQLAQETPIAPIVNHIAQEAQQRTLQRMREFLCSGEPILLLEVGQWLAKQPQSVHHQLIGTGDNLDQTLLTDLAEIALQMKKLSVSPWEVRYQLEACYQKSILLDLTEEERREWLTTLKKQDQSDDSS